MQEKPIEPMKLFFCYANKDEELLKKLKQHLTPLQQQGLIDIWQYRDISAGNEWEREISERLNSANIILLLISSNFMASEYCYSIEMKRAIERYEKGEVRVIPIILRPVYWQGGPLSKFQALPKDGIPVVSPSWHTMDEAFIDIVEGIRKAVELPINRLNQLILPTVGKTTSEPIFQPNNGPSSSNQLVQPIQTKILPHMKLVESTPNQSPPTRRSFMNMRAILLISLTILVIASGMGIFWSMRAAQVSLMNGKMTATTQANGNITATVTAANPYGGVLVLDDPLHDNSLGHWYQGSDSVSSCKFVGGTYQASFSPGPRISANAGRFCTALNSADFSNFTFEVQMTIIKGDFGGIVFRVPQDASGGYEFAVGQDGLYILQRMENSDRRLLLGPTFSSAIHMGLGQLNIITVFAQGNLIRLYINNQKIASVTDNMYSHGSVSLLADTYISTTNFHSTMVAYNNAKLWILP